MRGSNGSGRGHRHQTRAGRSTRTGEKSTTQRQGSTDQVPPEPRCVARDQGSASSRPIPLLTQIALPRQPLAKRKGGDLPKADLTPYPATFPRICRNDASATCMVEWSSSTRACSCPAWPRACRCRCACGSTAGPFPATPRWSTAPFCWASRAVARPRCATRRSRSRQYGDAGIQSQKTAWATSHETER